MVNILQQKQAGISVIDALGISGSKIASEMLLSTIPFVGNGTLRSGVIKSALALIGGTMFRNRVARIVTTGIMVDGAEDLVRGLLGVVGLGGGLGGAQRTSLGSSSNQGATVGGAI